MSISIRLASREEQAQFLSFLPMIWVACIPLGVSIEAIGLVLALTAILAQGQIWPKLKENLLLPWIFPLLAILTWTCLGLIWTPKINHDSIIQIKKILSFFLIPILMLGFRDEKQKDQALQAFLIASLIPFGMAVAKYYLAWQFHHDNDPGHLFYNHILTGFLVSYAAFVTLEFWFKQKKPIYLLAFFLFSYQLLIINTGKMAYFLYLSLMLMSLWQKTLKNYRYCLLAGALITSLLIIYLSPTIHQLLLGLKQEILEFLQGNKATSFGFRIQFHAFALSIFKQHWLIGAGPGAYHTIFAIQNPVPAWPYAPNVHSQYWLILAEQGLIGLGLWAWFCLSLCKTPSHNAFYQHLWLGLLLILAINGLTDIILLACPGYLFMAMAALSLKTDKE